jgi:hypothetical protein
MERMDPRQLNHVAASLAVWAYAVAQLPALLPRNESAPGGAPAGAGGAAQVPAAVAGGVAGAALAALAALLWWRTRGAPCKACARRAAGGDALAAAYSAVPTLRGGPTV